MKLFLFTELWARRQGGTPFAMVTDLTAGAQVLVAPDGAFGDLRLSNERLAQVRDAIALDRSGRLDDGPLFVHVFNPPPRLFIVGAVHIAQSLVPMARLAGYEVVLIDPRQAWASETRFPDVKILLDWPDDALDLLKPDRRSAIVTLTHDPKLDDPALRSALKSEAFYIGSLGSKRTHAKRLERLTEAGFDADTLARVKGPIGLAIGAKSPAEIAVSILAEVTRIRRNPPDPARPDAAA